MEFDYYEYNLAEHFLSALINNDYSGLDDSEADALNTWLAGLPVRGHWEVDSEELDAGPAFFVCDICQLHAMCYPVRHYFRETESC